MFGRFITFVLVCLFLAAGAAFLAGPWLHPGADEQLPLCPYLRAHDFSVLPPAVITASGAYEVIRETLSRGSIEGVPQQAEVIARAFVPVDPKIASVAKRLSAEQDVESARRTFMRLNRLMEKHARQPAQA